MRFSIFLINFLIVIVLSIVSVSSAALGDSSSTQCPAGQKLCRPIGCLLPHIDCTELLQAAELGYHVKQNLLMGMKSSSDDKIIDANFPMTEDGRTYHLGIKSGEVANRIVIVGDLERAQGFADVFFDKKTPVFRLLSSRGFLTLTGRYNGVPVSVIGTGMGTPMIDFSIREIRHVLLGDIAMIRVGTCGTPMPAIEAGNVVVNDQAVYVRRNPDAFRKDSAQEVPYLISLPASADANLTFGLQKSIMEQVNDKSAVHLGWDATADSFYSSQGRLANDFEDRNQHVFDALKEKYGSKIASMEMETFHMFDMASVCRNGTFHAGSALIVVAQRNTGKFIDNDLKHLREKQVGRAALDTLAQFRLEKEQHNGVWDNRL